MTEVFMTLEELSLGRPSDVSKRYAALPADAGAQDGMASSTIPLTEAQEQQLVHDKEQAQRLCARYVDRIQELRELVSDLQDCLCGILSTEQTFSLGVRSANQLAITEEMFELDE